MRGANLLFCPLLGLCRARAARAAKAAKAAKAASDRTAADKRAGGQSANTGRRAAAPADA